MFQLLWMRFDGAEALWKDETKLRRSSRGSGINVGIASALESITNTCNLEREEVYGIPHHKMDGYCFKKKWAGV